MIRLILAVAALALAPAAGAELLPLVDAHIHYSQDAWGVVSPEEALAVLAGAGVVRALVSSTPDDGTLRLYERAPRVVVPFLRPYRTRADMATWTRDPAVAAYVEGRLQRGIYRGIGEFHMTSAEVDGPVLARFAELAERHNLFWHAHVDAATVEALLTRYPRVRILWAHAGMSASAETVGRLLGRFSTLWVELSLRSDVAPGGTLDPAWQALFLAHPDRFLVGTDTWTPTRWGTLADGMRAVRQWLAQLPPDVAERIAYRNAERLFP